MDINSKAEGPAEKLSNFSPHFFRFDGVQCSSMEGLLQSFKFKDIYAQREVCGLVGEKAKNRGQERNEAWKQIQKLWWRGRKYDRHGQKYQDLLDRAFAALAKNTSFQSALLATGNSPLTYSIGESDQSETILTEYEFCSRLEKIRSKL